MSTDRYYLVRCSLTWSGRTVPLSDVSGGALALTADVVAQASVPTRALLRAVDAERTERTRLCTDRTLRTEIRWPTCLTGNSDICQSRTRFSVETEISLFHLTNTFSWYETAVIAQNIHSQLHIRTRQSQIWAERVPTSWALINMWNRVVPPSRRDRSTPRWRDDTLLRSDRDSAARTGSHVYQEDKAPHSWREKTRETRSPSDSLRFNLD